MWLQKCEFIVYSDRTQVIDREGINQLDAMKPLLLPSGSVKLTGKGAILTVPSRGLTFHITT